MGLNRELGVKWGIALTRACWAGLALGEGSPQRAVMSASAVASLCDSLGARLDVWEQQIQDQVIAAARVQLDQTTFEAAWEQGRAMTLEQAVACALDGTTLMSVG